MSLLKKTPNPFTSDEADLSPAVGTGSGKKSSRTNKILFLLIVISAGVAGYFYNQNNQLAKDPNKVAEEEIKQVVGKVGMLMVLPTGETPSMATVTDPKQLAKDPFFAKASVGDKVLLYPNARKLVLYNPSQNKIIEALTLNVSKQNP